MKQIETAIDIVPRLLGDQLNDLNNTPNHIHTELEFRQGKWKTTVFFKTHVGSSIFARGEDKDLLRSIAKCQIEIRRHT